MNLKESFQEISDESMGFLLKLLGFALVGLMILHPPIALGIGFILIGCYLVRQVYSSLSGFAPQGRGSAENSES